MKYNFLNSLDLDSEVILKISSLLTGVELGSSSVIVSPLGKNLDPDLILYGWDSIFNSNKALLNDELFELENLNRSKFGPRSLATNWEARKESVDDYFGQDSYHIVPDRYGNLPKCLRPISLQQGIKYLKNSTNSGLPFYRRKGDVKDILISDFSSLLDRCDPCVMFTRTQEESKTRTVWGYPCADTLNETLFYRPLLQYQKGMIWRSALLGPEAVDFRMTNLITQANQLGQTLLSIDFSAYDATVKTGLQKASFDYINSLYQDGFQDELGYIEERFNTIGLITPSGVYGGPHGVPSGSTFTNEVDSIAQFLCAYSLGLSPEQFDIQGDDGAYRVTDPELIKEGLIKFGLMVNDDKSYVSDNSLIYLQQLYSLDYMDEKHIIRGIYPTYRALCRIIYPERFDNFSVDSIIGADYYSIKTISILENCRNHPLFVDLVKFVAKLDKFKLSYTQFGLQKYIQRIKKSSGAEGLILHKPENMIAGLNSFKTVKILNELYRRNNL